MPFLKLEYLLALTGACRDTVPRTQRVLPSSVIELPRRTSESVGARICNSQPVRDTILTIQYFSVEASGGGDPELNLRPSNDRSSQTRALKGSHTRASVQFQQLVYVHQAIERAGGTSPEPSSFTLNTFFHSPTSSDVSTMFTRNVACMLIRTAACVHFFRLTELRSHSYFCSVRSSGCFQILRPHPLLIYTRDPPGQPHMHSRLRKTRT